jgi:glycosyltransferase involved in cell wall biosynthesis
MTASLCIPTYNRPALLRIAIDSALAQTEPPVEILVGDDSPGHETETLVAELGQNASLPIRYLREGAPLGQAANVERLFREATGERLILLHDDDLLLPSALATLEAAFRSDPSVIAAYGKQLILSEMGAADEAGSERLNRDYRRTGAYAGIQPSALKAALLQQFPNDGYMVATAVARRVGYRIAGVRDACDFAFAINLARAGGRFVFVDSYTTGYRMTVESVSRSRGDRSAWEALRLVLAAPDIDKEDTEVKAWLARQLPYAINAAAREGDLRRALAWYFAPGHRRAILTPGGLARLIRILAPQLTLRLKDALRRK